MAKDDLDWKPVNTQFSNRKTKAAYDKLRKAFDEAKEFREKVLNPAMEAFESSLKADMVKAGVADGSEYIVISHRFGLRYAVTDEPQEKRQPKGKAEALSV